MDDFSIVVFVFVFVAREHASAHRPVPVTLRYFAGPATRRGPSSHSSGAPTTSILRLASSAKSLSRSTLPRSFVLRIAQESVPVRNRACALALSVGRAVPYVSVVTSFERGRRLPQEPFFVPTLFVIGRAHDPQSVGLRGKPFFPTKF